MGKIRIYGRRPCFYYLNRLTNQLSCQGKSETLGFYIGVDEIGWCYPVGDLAVAKRTDWPNFFYADLFYSGFHGGLDTTPFSGRSTSRAFFSPLFLLGKMKGGCLWTVKVLKGFLPSPAELALKEETVKDTISLSRASVDFFKNEAKKYNTQYQKMIRRLLDEYTAHNL